MHKAMMDVIVRANKGLFEEVKEKDMCEAIRELFHDEIEEEIKKVRLETLIELVQDGFLPISDAAKRLEISEAELEAML